MDRWPTNGPAPALVRLAAPLAALFPGAPRLVEYWEQDPCAVMVPEEPMMMPSATGGAKSDYTAGEKAVRDKQYRAAIQRMSAVLKKEPRNVNALNYMGYSYRQLGEYRRALGYYRLALRFDPNHRGANEYLGQLYLRTGNLKGAQAQLARLRKICPGGCEEYDSLRDALRKKGVKG